MELEGNGYVIENEGRTQASRYMDVSLEIYVSFILIFKEFLLFAPRCW